jgi:TolB protein
VLKITKVLDDNAQNFHARPSPDGSRIAFDSDRDGERAVYVADEDGTHVRRVSGDGFAAVPSWAPDGQRLAFVKALPGKPNVWNVWIADLASGDLRQVTFNPYGQPWGGSWFPDGRRLAYSHEASLIILDLETGARRTYRTPVAGHLVRTPAVSPDGSRIIFQVRHDGTWLLSLPTGTMRKVLDDPSAEEYTWSPDGHRVAFHSSRAGGWGVFVMGQ